MFTFDVRIRPEIIAETAVKNSTICDEFWENGEGVPVSAVNAIDSTQKPDMINCRQPLLFNLDPSVFGIGICSGCSCTGYTVL